MKPRLKLSSETEEPSRVKWGIAGGLGLAAVLAVAYRGFPEADPGGPFAQASASATASASAPPTASAPLPPRCTESKVEGFSIGEPKRKAQADAGDEDDFAPFAVEVGKGTVFAGGFAVGTLRDGDGGTVAMVATLGFDGKGGKLVKLTRARGDLDPPVVAGAGNAILAAVTQPNASGRSIKIAKVTGTEVAWGPEFTEGEDGSTAHDLASTGARGVLVWDDISADQKHGAVWLASFDVGSLESVVAKRMVSGKADAEAPRIVTRAGGYWLGYVAQKALPEEATKKKKKVAGEAEDEDAIEAAAGEAVPNRWVEIVPLDENGVPVSSPRAATPKEGHVLGFDLTVLDDGVLVASREDDTPSGSGGGLLRGTVVRMGGEIHGKPLKEEFPGAGAPALFAGWLVSSGLSGQTSLAAVSPKGELLEALEIEPALGSGEALAAHKDQLLVARTNGQAMRLAPVRCTPRKPR